MQFTRLIGHTLRDDERYRPTSRVTSIEAPADSAPAMGGLPDLRQAN